MPGDSDTAIAHCDGYQYENVHTYDLRDDLARFSFRKKLDRFIDWFENAHTVHADEECGHRHFEVGVIELKCNVQQLSKRFRNIYWEVTVHNDD